MLYGFSVGNFVVATGGCVGNMSRQRVAGGFASNWSKNFAGALLSSRQLFSRKCAEFRCRVWLFSLENRFSFVAV